MQKLFLILFCFLFLLNSSCTTNKTHKDSWQIDMVSSISGIDNNPDIQEFKYEIHVSYIGKQSIKLFDIEPVIGIVNSGRIIEETNSEISRSDKLIKVGGKMLIDTKGLTKQQIDENMQIITGVKIDWIENGKKYETIKEIP